MHHLTPQARFDSDYSIEIADDINQDLGETADYLFVYRVHDEVYLCKIEDEADDAQWRYEGEFEGVGKAAYEATDHVAKETDTVILDYPGLDTERALYTRDE